MKYPVLVFFFVSYLGVFSSFAQSTIIDELQTDRFMAGTVRIEASPEINRLIGKKTNLSNVAGNFIKTNGHRVQIFSGNEPRVSKEEAYKKQELINETFPDIPTYVTYKAPYWRLRVGDFRSHEEAFLAMKQIVQEIPALKKESYVVKDEIKIPVNE